MDNGIPEQWRNILIFFNSDLRDITFNDYSTNLHFLETKMNDKFNLILRDLRIENMDSDIDAIDLEIENSITDLYDYIEGINNPAIGSQIMSLGIFDLSSDIIRTIIETTVTQNNVNLYWGGHYNSIKDYMHFEIRPRSIQQQLQSLDMQIIKNFLNEYEDGERY